MSLSEMLSKSQETFRWKEHLDEVLPVVAASAPELSRGDVEKILHLERRAALRLMEKFDPIEGAGGVWWIKRDHLRAWLEAYRATHEREHLRARMVREALSEGQKQDAQLRAGLARAGKPVAAWVQPERVYAASVRGLPKGVSITPDRIVVEIPAGDPEEGARRLHALGLALLNDWDGFVRLVGGPIDDSVAGLAQFEAELQADKQEGIEGWGA